MAKKAKKSLTANNLLNALLYVLIGVLMCVFKAGLLEWLMTGIGIVLMVTGILKAVKKYPVEGILTAAVGLLILIGGWQFVDIMLLVLGVILVAKGLIDLIRAVRRNNLAATVAAIITTTVGVALIISKWALLDWVFIVLGVILIVDGLLCAIGK